MLLLIIASLVAISLAAWAWILRRPALPPVFFSSVFSSSPISSSSKLLPSSDPLHSDPQLSPPPDPHDSTSSEDSATSSSSCVPEPVRIALSSGGSARLGGGGVGRRPQRALLVIAHPDDETMFFAPTIFALLRAGARPFILCMSSGDAAGEGARRARELPVAAGRLGVDPSDVIVLDVHPLRDGAEWRAEEILDFLLAHVQAIDADCVISFDDYGISGHQNHRSCGEGLYLLSQYLPNKDVRMLQLTSPPLWRKYLSLFALPLVLLLDEPSTTTFSFPGEICRAWSAMAAHRSQLVWFRYLYVLFSSLMLSNTFVVLPRSSPTVTQQPVHESLFDDD